MVGTFSCLDAWNPMGSGSMDPSLQPQALLGHQTPVPHGQPQLRGGPHVPQQQQMPVSIQHQEPKLNPIVNWKLPFYLTVLRKQIVIIHSVQ